MSELFHEAPGPTPTVSLTRFEAEALLDYIDGTPFDEDALDTALVALREFLGRL